MAPCRYMLDYVRSTGWNVRADARVIPYAYPEPRYREAGATGAEPRELVFFGRLETRKGLEIFLQAAQQLDPRIALTFLGRDTVLGTGMAASELIRSQLKGRRFSLRTDYNQEQAVQYLREGRRLAVISSLSDNFPNTVIECLVNGIPFVASAVGGIPEILTEPELREALLFQPTAPDLVRCLHAYLAAPAERRRSWRDRARQVADPGAHNQRVAEAYAGLLSPSQAVCPAARPEPPLVSVAVSHRNLGAYLPECLAALAGQSYPRLEVLVVDQGSTCPHAVRVFQEQEKLYPQFHFLQQASGAASTRRCGLDRRADAAPLALARGEFFLTLDADQVCTPHLVERLASALARNPHLTALTCYGLGYAETQNPAVDQAIQASRPTAGPYNLAPFENAFGHGPVLFRTRDLRAVGGYESEPDLGEEWVVFHKLAQQGYRTDVVPEYLFAYRCGVRSTAGLGEDLRNHRRALLKHFRVDLLPLAEATGLWDLVITTSRRLAQVNRQAAGPESQTGSDLYHRVQHLERVNEELHREIQRLRGLPAPAPAFRYRLADHLNNTMKKAAPLHYLAKQSCWLAWRAAQQARRLKAWAIPGRRAA
ncbi:MAG: glycosyltransferase, partial [Planctomycetes bacterium]|nr:glycosyltransferase [Planctomycetota bacterium]